MNVLQPHLRTHLVHMPIMAACGNAVHLRSQLDATTRTQGSNPRGPGLSRLIAAGLLFAVSSLAGCDAPTSDTSATGQASVQEQQSATAITQPAGPSQRVAALLEAMTLEQKVGQMIQGEIKSVKPEDVRDYGLGSVLNGGGSFPYGKKQATVAEWLAVADAYYAASIDTSAGNAGIPIIWGTDAVHGHNNVIGATLFPHNIGLGAANDPELVGKIAAATAREVKATGIDWIFAPTVAVAQDPRWGRTYESFSSDPERVRQFAAPIVTGMQRSGVVATAKHFIGDGGTFRGIDQGDTRLDLETLLEEHGQGYIEAIAAGTLSVMATFNSWNGDKIHGSRELLTDVLKERMGFEGFVVSDWNGIGQVSGCTNDNCAQAINAGIDMVMVPEDWKAMYLNILAQVRAGEIPMARIDDAVTRILMVKEKIGLLDRRAPSIEAEPLMSVIGAPEHRAIAREAVRRSLVLLKNQQGLVPLDPRGTLLVTGPGADDIGQQSGGWTVSWQGTGNTNDDFPGGQSILDGIAAQVSAAGGSVITSVEEGTPDAVIYVFGETPYAEGVGDIETLAWQQRSKQDLANINALLETGKPVVAVFLSGRPMWVNAEINAANAFVAAWLPGSEGAGVADVLLRNANGEVQYPFEGRLAMPWPRFDLNASNPDLPVADVLFPIGYGADAGEDIDVTGLPEGAIGVLETSDEILFEGSVREPWMIYLGDELDPALAAGPSNAKSAAGHLSLSVVDKEVQEDARRLAWGESGQTTTVYFGRGQAWDASGLAGAGGALTFAIRTVEAGSKNLQLSTQCGANCGATVALNQIFETAALGEWVQYALPLSCLETAGLDMTAVTSPFVLASTGALTLELAQVAIVERPGEGVVTLECGAE